MDKKDYRKISISKRNSLSENDRKQKDSCILEKLIDTKDYICCDALLTYCSYNNETDTIGIITHALSLGKKVYCPKITDKAGHQMVFFEINSLDDLKPGYMTIPEPIGDISYNGEEFNYPLLIMPGTAFDKELTRIGYGGGYYDRFSEKNPHIRKIAIAYSCQVFDTTLPKEKTDINPDMLITESFIIKEPF
ncbi:MAG: 5-formyltetrahydrofolate cyclo-ligase [Butyrivibrio sp.]|nr:5-formyltetrahydrofolate cyclo-ligase [Butyrivibrio sp.]